jgi:hypothetical protein
MQERMITVARVRTVGELKEYIKDLSDDMTIVKYHSDMEKSGYLPMLGISTRKMVSEQVETYDAFDGESYTYEAFSFTDDDSGVLCLMLD